MMMKCIKDKENNSKLSNSIEKNIETMKNLKIGWEDIKISKLILNNSVHSSDIELSFMD